MFYLLFLILISHSFIFSMQQDYSRPAKRQKKTGEIKSTASDDRIFSNCFLLTAKTETLIKPRPIKPKVNENPNIKIGNPSESLKNTFNAKANVFKKFKSQE